jgi:hypothetical protein
MHEPTELMSKYVQLMSISWWISEYTDYKIITHFSGKDESLSIRVYENKNSPKASELYSVENIWTKPEKIAYKEMDNIANKLLLIKNQF